MNFNLSRASNLQSLFKYDTTNGYDNWRDLSIRETGTFSTTGIFLNTAFENVNADNGWVSEAYNNFENARFIISQRQALADDRVLIKGIDPSNKKFYYGYGAKSQNTLIPAFLSAYTGVNQSRVSLSPFRNVPLPNWNLNYNGLSKIKKLSKTFSNITIQHRYTGTYMIGGYTSNLFYSEDSLASSGRDLVSKYNINNVSIREQFNPLIGIDVTTKSGITGGVKINRTRNITLFVPNANLTEQTSKDFTFNFGYRTSGVKLPIKYNGKRIFLNNDLLMDMIISIANNYTIVRMVDQNTNTVQAGQRVVSIRPNINYMINSNINLSIFYDRRASKPHASNAYPTALTTFGIKLRYTIQ
jgi:cell surface protein SprA